MSTASFDIRAARRLLRELHECQRAVAERESSRRLDAIDRVQEAIRRIGEIGTATGILDRAAAELGAATRFHRILISELAGRLLVPRRLWSRVDSSVDELQARLGELAIPLAYPLVEAQLAPRSHGEALLVDASEPRSPAPLRALLGWDVYVVSTIALQGGAIGFLHAELSPQQAGDPALQSHLVCTCADGLARAFERAALREMLQRHRHELRAAMLWINSELAEPDDLEPALPAKKRFQPAEQPSVDVLTSREAQVLRLLGRGRTNASIALSLTISESTVKFHVKNILLKLGAKSRADAVARHMRGAI